VRNSGDGRPGSRAKQQADVGSWAITGREQMQQQGALRKPFYSITSSATASSPGGMTRPSAFAVCTGLAQLALLVCGRLVDCRDPKVQNSAFHF
jgi:hypothetical protein